MTIGINVKYLNSKFFVLGSGTNTIAYSTNGSSGYTGLGTTIFSVSGRDVMYKTSGNYVFVGEGTNSIVTTSNLSSWTGYGFTTSKILGGYSVDSNNNNVYVVGGRHMNRYFAADYSGILSSSDGISWTVLKNNTGLGSYPTALAYAPDIHRIVCARGLEDIPYPSFIYSDNGGDTWSNGTNNIFYGANDVKYGNGKWVAVGGPGSTYGFNNVATSSDGITWTGLGTSQFAGTNKSVLYVSTLNIWYVIGNGAKYSTDNTVTWNNSSFGGSLLTIAFKNNKLIATYNGSFYTSSNGISWTVSSVVPGSVGIRWIEYGNGVWLAGQNESSASDGIVYSLDNALTWSQLIQGTGLGYKSIQYNPYDEIFVGYYGKMAYSSDGINWTDSGTTVFNNISDGRSIFEHTVYSFNTLVTSSSTTTWTGLGSTIFSKFCNSVAYNGTDKWVAVGVGSSTSNSVAYSSNGSVWTGLGKTLFNIGSSAKWTNGKFYITGDNDMYSSTDGFTWASFNVPFRTGAYDVAYGTNTNGEAVWVAMGDRNSIAYSYDTISWYGIGTTIFTIGKGVTFNRNRFIATGSGNHTVAYSVDGINWGGRGSVFSTYGNNVGANNLLTVIGRSNTTAIGYRAGYQNQSTNSVSIGFSSGAYNQSNDSVAIGSYAGFTGQSYASVALGVRAGYANQGSGSVQIGYEAGYLGVSDVKKFVAVGASTDTLLTCSDGVSWSGLGTSIFSTQGNAVASNNKTWIAVGSGTNTVARSGDNTVNWSGYGATLFSTAGKCVVYGNNLWVIAGTGTNTLMTSADDGLTFTARSHTLANINGLSYANGYYFAGGDSSGSTSQIAYSADGITWSEFLPVSNDGTTSSKLTVSYVNSKYYVIGNYYSSNHCALHH